MELWEDVDIARDLKAPYDIVIASLSLTMYDIREALQKMDAAATDSVHLFWFADMAFYRIHKSAGFPGNKCSGAPMDGNVKIKT